MEGVQSTSMPAPRRRGLAVLLSLFCTGLGQIYAGRGRRGAVLLGLALLHAPALVVLSRAPPSVGGLAALGGLLLCGLALFVFALLDAARCARRAEVPFARRVYNHVGLYVALIAFATLWEVGGMAWVRAHAFEAFRIASDSMAPSVVRGDRILVDKARAEDLRRGDVIIYRAPGQRQRSFVKRVIALAGEEVRLEGEMVLVDGRPLALTPEGDAGSYRESDGERSWRVRWSRRGGSEGQNAAVTVPDGHVYVLGDQRDASVDSRRHGPVPLGDVVGVARYVILPGADGTFGLVR